MFNWGENIANMQIVAWEPATVVVFCPLLHVSQLVERQSLNLVAKTSATQLSESLRQTLINRKNSPFNAMIHGEKYSSVANLVYR